MKNADFFKLNLPKWPCMVVTGKQITPEQAQVVLIRTDGFYFSTNDRDLERELREAAGLPEDRFATETDWNTVWEKEQAAKKRYGILPLEYLNNSRVVSCYIGGPHGWCDWNGMIFCHDFNIGKWPSVEEVYNEWKIIAKAFPFLDLRCQLMSGESCEEYITPVVEFIVKNGRVRMVEPNGMLEQPAEFSTEAVLHCFTMTARARESGISVSGFKAALAATETSLADLETFFTREV